MKRVRDNDSNLDENKNIRLEKDGIPEWIRSCPGWPTILSHLELIDIEPFRQTHPEAWALVTTCLSAGVKLTIGEDTLVKYPLNTHSDLYAKYGCYAINIEMKQILRPEVEGLTKLFPGIQELTLRRICVDEIEDVPEFPAASVRKLSLINNSIYNHFLYAWMMDLKTLESLHMENNDWVMLPSFPNLKSLTLVGQKIGVYSDDPVFPSLKHLTVDNIDTLPIDRLRHLPLDKLKIIRSVDPKHKADLDSLNVPSVDVFYFHIPTEADDVPILLLNEYCLLHIETYLSIEDWLSFRRAHVDFYALPILRISITKQNMDDDAFTKELPAIGPLVSKLFVVGPTTSQFVTAMEYCVNLVELNLQFKHTDEEICKVIPTGLQKLTLSRKFDGSAQIREMYRRLNPTLRYLHNSALVMKTPGIEELHNVEHFVSDQIIVTQEFLEFLGNNEKTLTKFETHLKLHSELDRDFWLALARMQKLQTLILNTEESECQIPPLPNGVFPMLETLLITCDQDLGGFLGTLEGTRLKHLNIFGVQIKVLEIVPKILRFIRLKRLRLYQIDDQIVHMLVPALQHLVDIQAEVLKITNEGFIKLRAVLKQQGRKLRLNDHQLG